MEKYNRVYECVFEIKETDKKQIKSVEQVKIALPFTVEFEISSSVEGNDQNVGVFNFYNLSEIVQKKLWLDVFNYTDKTIEFTFYAGYKPNSSQVNMPMVYKGTVFRCSSYRSSGSVDTITSVQVIGGYYIYKTGYANATFEANTEYADAINALINDVPEVTLGYVSDDLPQIPKNQTFMGRTMDLLLQELSGYMVFEDLGQIHVLGEGYYIPNGQIQLISESTGLLGTPRMAEQQIIVDMVFEPGLRIGQIVFLECEYALIKKQQCQIMSLQHKGMISPTVCSKAITTVTLFRNNLKMAWKSAKLRKDITQRKIAPGEWVKPVDGKISSPYGWRVHPIYKTRKFHAGIDIGAKAGDPIKAAANGTVIFSGKSGGYGNFVTIDHGKNAQNIKVSSSYGHMSQYSVHIGQNVFKGDTIGYVGSTGVSTGPHLHFEVKENGNSVNPSKYIRGY